MEQGLNEFNAGLDAEGRASIESGFATIGNTSLRIVGDAYEAQ